MPWIPQGNGNLAYWCRLLPAPVVGIGGMDVTRATQAAECGAAGVAVISAITAAASPETAIAVLKRAIDRPVGGTPSYRHVALPQSTLSL
jgi:thiamine monophosphate synthase